MKLRTLPMQGPSRGLPETGFIRLRFAFLIFATPPEASMAPSISFTMRDRSRTLPSSPMMPGFSRPGAPYRTSFILSVLLERSVWKGCDGSAAIMHGRGRGATLSHRQGKSLFDVVVEGVEINTRVAALQQRS